MLRKREKNKRTFDGGSLWQNQINKNHIDAQQGVNMFPFFCSQIMQLDIFGEFQQDKNIIMILPEFFGLPYSTY